MLNVGVILPSVDVQRRDDLTIATAARHAEDIGLDSVWHGDRLVHRNRRARLHRRAGRGGCGDRARSSACSR
jgi:hypothetical protein